MSNNVPISNDEPKAIQYGFGNNVNVTVEFLSDTAMTVEIKCYTQDGDVVRVVTQKSKTDNCPYTLVTESEDIKIET